MHKDCYHKMYKNEECHRWFKLKADIVKALLSVFVNNLADKKLLMPAAELVFYPKQYFILISCYFCQYLF